MDPAIQDRRRTDSANLKGTRIRYRSNQKLASRAVKLQPAKHHRGFQGHRSFEDTLPKDGLDRGANQGEACKVGDKPGI